LGQASPPATVEVTIDVPGREPVHCHPNVASVSTRERTWDMEGVGAFAAVTTPGATLDGTPGDADGQVGR